MAEQKSSYWHYTIKDGLLSLHFLGTSSRWGFFKGWQDIKKDIYKIIDVGG